MRRRQSNQRSSSDCNIRLILPSEHARSGSVRSNSGVLVSLSSSRDFWIGGCLAAPLPAAQAQVPQAITYQGSLSAGAVPYSGAGLFKFALVNGSGTASFWSNDGSSVGGGQPNQAITNLVTRGLFTVVLGDPNMQPVSSAVFTNSDVRLRIWFNDGTNGFAGLSPDQRLNSSGFAMMAASVPNGAVTSNNLAAGAVSTPSIAAGAITSAQLAVNAVITPALANGSVTAAKLAPQAVTSPALAPGAVTSATRPPGRRPLRQSRAGVRHDSRHRQWRHYRRRFGAQRRDGLGHC